MRRSRVGLTPAGRPSQEDLDAIQSPFAGTMMESCSVTQVGCSACGQPWQARPQQSRRPAGAVELDGLRRHSAGARTTWVCSCLHVRSAPAGQANRRHVPACQRRRTGPADQAAASTAAQPCVDHWQHHSIARLPQQLLGWVGARSSWCILLSATCLVHQAARVRACSHSACLPRSSTPTSG